MGYYYRRSLSFGPLRFNLSGSGIGASIGVKGARLGLSPRGMYVRGGMGGFQYQQFLTSPASKARPTQTVESRHAAPAQTPTTPIPDHFEKISSGDIAGMTDASSEALLNQLNSAAQSLKPFKPAGVLGIVVTLVAAYAGGIPGAIIGLVLGIAIAGTGYWLQLRNCTTPLMYDLEESAVSVFQARVAALDRLNSADRLSHVSHKGEIKDKKYAAGATGSVVQHPVTVATGDPPGIRTNVSIPTLPAGDETLYFFPDRLLVFARGKYGAVSYPDLRIEIDTVNMVEQKQAPTDAPVIATTWQYVNAKGGPDKRFKDNRELPVCQYERATFKSHSGLMEQFQWSKPNMGESLSAAFSSGS